MIPKELAKRIRYIEIFTTKAVNDVLAGHYESVFKGRGMEFDEVREYTPGDDVRTIDWNVTARAGRPYVKRFVEERELTVMLLVDLSASGAFGSVRQLKNEAAAEIAAMLAFSAVRNNDKVGLILFTDRIEKFIPPKKGITHILRVIRELLGFAPARTKTDIAGALRYLGRVTHKRSVVFLISDFWDSGFEKEMRILGRRHDLIAVSVADPREHALPRVGLIELEDSETGRLMTADTGSAAVRGKYERLTAERSARLRDLFASIGVDHIETRTDRDSARDLVKFFRKRERRRA